MKRGTNWRMLRRLTEAFGLPILGIYITTILFQLDTGVTPIVYDLRAFAHFQTLVATKDHALLGGSFLIGIIILSLLVIAGCLEQIFTKDSESLPKPKE